MRVLGGQEGRPHQPVLQGNLGAGAWGAFQTSPTGSQRRQGPGEGPRGATKPPQRVQGSAARSDGAPATRTAVQPALDGLGPVMALSTERSPQSWK